MNLLYLDCPTGISGDMLLAALLDLGVDRDSWEKSLRALPLDFSFECRETFKNGLRGLKVEILPGGEAGNQPHRNLGQILEAIKQANFSPWVTEKAHSVFTLLGETEARLHGKPPEEIHFHEVGAIDSIVDIVGVLLCLEQLSVAKVLVSPLPWSKGFVECAHGTLPVPAPATLELLKGATLIPSSLEGELITPTGAALCAVLAEPGVAMPPLKVKAIGSGAGSRELPVPNILRAILGVAVAPETKDFPPAPGLRESITVLETTIDDASPEVVGYVFERLLRAGVLDAYLKPVIMKKNRNGTLLTVLAKDKDVARITDILFRETTTLGIRISRQERVVLSRRVEMVETIYGTIPVKKGFLPETGEVLNMAPEYELCRKTAIEHGVPIKDVYWEVMSVLTKK